MSSAGSGPRRGRRAASAALVAALLLLTGCAGTSSRGSGSAAHSSRVPVTADAFSAYDGDATGEILGRVLDDELRPLDDVRVQIVGTKVETRTAADGLFLFQQVPPNAYTLAFQKPGFETATVRVVVADERVVLDVLLPDAPDTTAWIDDAFVFRGRLSCSARVNYTGTNTNPECGQATADTDTQRQRYVDLLADIRWLLVEVSWQASVPGANDRLTLALRPYQGLSWRQVTGPSPIRVLLGAHEWSAIKQMSEKDYPAFGGQLQLMMFPGEWASHQGLAVGATVQQDFTIYATGFYWMDPPDAYTRLSG